MKRSEAGNHDSNLHSNVKLNQILINLELKDYNFIKWGLKAIQYLAKQRIEFITSCDVWALIDSTNITPENPRSMGVVFKVASKNGLIEQTSNFRPSQRKQANSRPVRVWRLVK